MRNHKHKIIILSVLLALAVGVLIFAASARAAYNSKPETEVSAISAARFDGVVLAANDDGTLAANADGGGIDISPLGWWEDLMKIPELIKEYGTLHVGDYNTTVASGTYTNKAFGYTCSASMNYVQERHESGSWGSYWVSKKILLSNSNTNGWYYFRGYNPSPQGDYSYESKICLDTVKPQIQARVNGNSVANGTVTTSSSAVISILGSDTLSGVNTYWYTMNGYGGTYYQCYSGSTFSSDGVYTFYCVDRAGNVSDTVTVTKDTTAPTVRAYNGSSQIGSGAILYAASARFEASDSTTGVAGIYIRVPNSSSYVNYGTAATLSTEGLYYYYARDNAGNQSSTYSFTIDRTAPTAYLYSGTTSVTNNYYSAASYIRFTASDTNGCYLYMKKDSGSYTSYTSGTNLTAEGVYSFYAVDACGNSTSTYTITLDRTAPVGTLYAGTTAVTNGKITNAAYVKYTATDNLALNALYVRKPNTTSYVTYVSGTQFDLDGTYYFYSTDKSGTPSATMSIVLDKVKPTVEIMTSGVAVSSGGFINSGTVSFMASDTTSGVANMYVKLPNTSGYISYVAGTPFSTEGLYYFSAVDAANNMSDTVSIMLDTTKPLGTIMSNDSIIPNEGYTNKSFSYFATDALSGITYCEIKSPDGAWEPYIVGTLIPANIGGWFSFRSYDLAGNMSDEYSVCVIVKLPDVTLYADEYPVIKGTYTNAARIAMSASGEYVKTCYIRLPGASTFIPYTQYLSFTTVGRYEFFAQDYAGGTTDIHAIIVDRTAKSVTLNGVANGIASGDVSLTWTDGDNQTTAVITSVTVNGKTYTKGDIIKTIDGGTYTVKTVDASDNIWTATFTANRVEVLSETLNKQYFETIDASGKAYAFDGYDNAIAYATAREAALVRTAAWNSSTWDGGIPMDTADSANAENGKYYIYKKSGDKSVEVAYFTLERLNAVIAEYAAASVTSYYWWEKVPSAPAPFENLYSLTCDRVFVGSSVNLADHANYLIDGQPYLGLIYSAEGEHVLTVFDDYGNSYEYVLVIVKTPSDILYKLNGGAYNKALGDRLYSFKEAVTLTITDSLDSDFAMYIIRNGLDEIIATVGCGEEFTLENSGRFTVQAINHSGLSLEVSFILSLDVPTAVFTENAVNKRLELRIEPSGDGSASLTEITIYRSMDGGVTWTNLIKDDYGRTINIDRLYYEFNCDGLYKVVVEDKFRSGIDAITAITEYAKPAPESELIGVNDGGYTNGTVKFTWTDEAAATVTFNGVANEYLSGTELSKDGEYVLTFTDDNGFEAVYTFTIKTALPVVELSIEPTNGYLTESVYATFENDCSAVLYKDGTLIGGYESGSEITEDGAYELIVTDLASNTTTITFIVDTTPPTAELVGVKDGGTVKGGSVVIRKLSESATLEVYFNGSLISYTSGESLSKLGSYRVRLTDAAGNVTEYTFEIAYAVNAAGTIIIIVIILAIIGGVVAVFLFRKRGKFKTKK